MTSLLVSSRNAENLKLFWFQVHSELQRKTTQNPKLALSSSKRQAGNWTKNKETQANNARQTVGELLGHFPSKIRFVFRSKTFPKNDALTQKRSNVQDNSDVTKQSLSSIPSIKVRCHFGNFFVKPSAVFVLLTLFLLLFTAQKEKKHISSPLNIFLLTFRGFKMAEEKMSKF